jgi:hypothetical protein
MVSDDLMAQLGSAQPAFDPMKTQKLPPAADRTQKMDAADMEKTQIFDGSPVHAPQAPARQAAPAARPVRAPDGDRTQKITALDPGYNPEATQKLTTEQMEKTAILPEDAAGAQVTQRLDDSIWRLQEARRILQGLPKS